jgi:hypothetical protein
MTARLANRWSRVALAAMFAGTCALAAGACDDSPSSPSPTSTLTIMLTDAPIDAVQQVNIFFTGVTVKPSGQSVQRLELQLTPNPVDLLTLDTQVVALATGVVPAGDYEFIQIEIDPVRSSVMEDGVAKPVQTPSSEIKVLGGFTVDEATGANVTLDFDAEKSLLPLGNGNWLLKPVIVKANGGSPLP